MSAEAASALPATMRSSSLSFLPTSAFSSPLACLLALSSFFATPMTTPVASSAKPQSSAPYLNLQGGGRPSGSSPQDSAAAAQDAVRAGGHEQHQADNSKPEKRLDDGPDQSEDRPDDQ